MHKKRKRLVGLVMIVIVVGILSQKILKIEKTSISKIWIISDLHYLSPKLHDGGSAFQRIEATAAGKDLTYGKERMEALLVQARKEKPDLLIVSGDLTFNGEYQSLADLATFFKKFEASGIEVLVEPGNHDIADGWAREFRDDHQYKTKQISPEAFIDLMGDYGYNQAADRDTASLTYVTKATPKQWFLMIDSNRYAKETGKGAPKTNGRLKQKTLRFVEKQLKQAKKAGAQIIPIMHHNVLDQHKRPTRGYTLDNATVLRELYKQYPPLVAFSGHIHTQNIQQQSLEHPHMLTEIVTGAFSLYPSSISELRIDEQKFSYQQKSLDMASWARGKGISHSNLLDHKTYLKEKFDAASNLLVHERLHDEGWYDAELAEAMSAIIEPVNLVYFSGQAIDDQWLEEKVYSQPIYQQVSSDHPESFVISYIDQVAEESHSRSDQKINLPLKDKN